MILLLHTSTPTIRLGLADDDHVIARDEFPSDRQLASTLSEKIRALLKTQNAQPSTLTKIVVYVGPGGFTGLRVGVTTANALAYALGIPVVGLTGEVRDLEDLLKKSKTAEPVKAGIVVPVYSKPPDIGPVLH